MFYSRKLGIRSVSPMGLLSNSHSLTEFIYDRRAYIPSHERASPGQYTVKSHIHIGIQDVGGGHLASDNLTGFLTFTLSYLVRNYLEDKHRLIKISRSFTTFHAHTSSRPRYGSTLHERCTLICIQDSTGLYYLFIL